MSVRLQRAVRASLAAVEEAGSEANPMLAWARRRWLLRWRRLTDELWELLLSECRRRSTAAAQRRGLAFQVPWPGGLRVQTAAASDELRALAVSTFGVALTVPWEHGGSSGRRPRVDGVWRAVQAAEGEARAWRLWAWAGGLEPSAAEARRAVRLRDAQMVAKVVGFRGGRISSEEAARLLGWIAEVAPSSGVPRRRMPAARRRQLDNGMIAAGLAPDGRRRWAVDEVLRWRGGHRDREALVRWAGVNRWTGAPHPIEWVARGDLTADLRAQGRLRAAAPRQAPAPKRAPPAERADGAPKRVSPRLAGHEPVGGIAGTSRAPRRQRSPSPARRQSARLRGEPPEGVT